MTGTGIRVFLVEGHAVVRRGLVELLSTSPALAVVGAVATAAEAVAEIPAARPQVVLLDAQRGGAGGGRGRRGRRSRDWDLPLDQERDGVGKGGELGGCRILQKKKTNA